MEIEKDIVYEHEDYDEILVLSIHRVYSTYDTKADEGRYRGVTVKFAREWDGYGAMPAAITSEPIDQFVKKTGDKLQTIKRETE